MGPHFGPQLKAKLKLGVRSWHVERRKLMQTPSLLKTEEQNEGGDREDSAEYGDRGEKPKIEGISNDKGRKE